ncbi:MAG: hypothetical protein JOY54_14930 [Acidobacteriaceae bacterium]|nr:hypothetical protein [Acidobacteriaceae bacterium]
MPGLSAPLVASVIENGIKRPIQMLVDSRSYPAALVLTYSGMDTMAFLSMAVDRSDVMRSDFIAWVERYIHLTSGQEITARDLYGARCSALHGGAHSRLSRSAECKPLAYVADSQEFHAPLPGLSVSVRDLVTAFFAGIDVFLADVQADEAKSSIVEQRLEHLLTTMPYSAVKEKKGTPS